MEKIVCDICRTRYPETEESCPLCGCSREFSLESMGEGMAAEPPAPRAPKKNREIFDFDEVNQEKNTDADPEEDDFDEEEEYDEGLRTNVFLVVILVVLIVLLLLASGFFFVRYFLPNMMDAEEPTQPVVTTQPVQTDPVETTDPGIPCTNLSIPGGKVELGKDGLWLLNVQVYPTDTTDALVYTSSDESIATVSETGTVTAVGEGTAVITVTCGQMQINCKVTVDYSIGAETVPTVEIPAPEAENSDVPDGTTDGEAQATEATEAEEQTQPDETGTEPETDVLKLKESDTDITINARYTSVQLELEGDIKPEDLSWFTMDSTIAICHDGLVTSTGSGMTRIYGEYNGQQVMCIVRCIF